jgi:multiple sugar transport system substrate-binding protein
VGDGQRQAASCLAGDNLLINASSEMKDEAWEFIRFITSEESQKTWALAEPNVPARETLYDDRQVLEAMPVIPATKKALQRARLRPVSPYYSEISRKMAEQFNSVLTDATSPEQAVETLQRELTQIIERGQ